MNLTIGDFIRLSIEPALILEIVVGFSAAKEVNSRLLEEKFHSVIDV